MLNNLIANQWTPSAASGSTPVFNPSRGIEIARCPIGTAADVDTAVRAAQAALPEWSNTPPGDRARILFKYKALLEENYQAIALLICREHGKTLIEAQGDLRRGIDVVDLACGIPSLLMGQKLGQVARNIDGEAERFPVGVCAGITPYNFPAMIPLWMFPVALACATVGIVVGVVSISGIGLKLATGIVGLSQGVLLVTCLLTMIAAIVLGTALPTSASYIITSIMAAPALIQLGIPALAAHMFVFYFGILADLTPPTAISTYATSAIAGSDVWRTQWTAMLLALSGFIIPYSFVYDPALLMINATPFQVIVRTLTTGLGVYMLGAGVIGFMRVPAVWWERVLLVAGAGLLIFSGYITAIAGLACFAVVMLTQRGRVVAYRAVNSPP